MRPSVDRVLEIVEKYEEDMTDKARLHGDLKVVLDIGEAIEVSPERDRHAVVDPLMVQIQQSLQAMIDVLAEESPVLKRSPRRQLRRGKQPQANRWSARPGPLALRFVLMWRLLFFGGQVRGRRRRRRSSRPRRRCCQAEKHAGREDRVEVAWRTRC